MADWPVELQLEYRMMRIQRISLLSLALRVQILCRSLAEGLLPAKLIQQQ